MNESPSIHAIGRSRMNAFGTRRCKQDKIARRGARGDRQHFPLVQVFAYADLPKVSPTLIEASCSGVPCTTTGYAPKMLSWIEDATRWSRVERAGPGGFDGDLGIPAKCWNCAAMPYVAVNQRSVNGS